MSSQVSFATFFSLFLLTLPHLPHGLILLQSLFSSSLRNHLLFPLPHSSFHLLLSITFCIFGLIQPIPPLMWSSRIKSPSLSLHKTRSGFVLLQNTNIGWKLKRHRRKKQKTIVFNGLSRVSIRPYCRTSVRHR